MDSTGIGGMEMIRLFLTPEVLLLFWAIAMILLECFFEKWDASFFAKLSMLGLGLVFASTWIIPAYEPPLWGAAYVVDALALFFKRLFLLITMAVLAMGKEYISQIPHAKREFFILPLLTAFGLMLLASAGGFVMLFISLELVTISFYILVSWQRDRLTCLEAGIKYLVIGALSTGFFVYGIAFLYGTVGMTDFKGIAGYTGSITPALQLAVALIAVGLGFKIAAVPFHAWVPDVYQGAPTPITAFLTVASKSAGFLMLIRVFCLEAFGGIQQLKPTIHLLLLVMAGASMILGSFGALMQRNLKRLFGYSSIANAGFMLMALVALNHQAISAVLFYLLVYGMASILALFIISVLTEELQGDHFSSYAGLSQKRPLMAFGLLVAFVSLAGIPPMVGFFGKLGVFAVAWESGYTVLVWLGLISAVAGVYYYLSIIRYMYWMDPIESRSKTLLPLRSFVRSFVIVLSAAILVFGVWQKPLVKVVDAVKIPLAKVRF